MKRSRAARDKTIATFSRRARELTALRAVHRLAVELCNAVDAAEEDIGGCRPISEILGELGPACDKAEEQ